MNRKRLKAIEIIFDLVKFRFDLTPGSVLPTNFYSKRFIKGNEAEEEWLTRCEILESIEISRELGFCLLSFNEEYYFATIGTEEATFIPEGFEEIELNSGVFTTIISELELPVKSGISNNYLEQNILSQNTLEPLYKGHDLHLLSPIFPKIKIYKLTANYFGEVDNLYQIISVFITNNPRTITLPFSKSTINNLQELILVNSNIISYETIVQALFSSNFKFAFLNLYRCIEMLYQIIYIETAHDHLGLSINKIDFLQAIDSKLKWRPNERNSINKLFSETPSRYKVELFNTLKEFQVSANSSANWVYDLRCNIVHLKSLQTNTKLKNHEWDNLIGGVTRILTHWYYKFNNYK